MPTATLAPTTDDRRAMAQRARHERARRIAQLRSRVVATALGTFVLAFAVIAFDGSMGAQTTAATAPPETTSAGIASAATDDEFDDDGTAAAVSADTGSSSDALTTSQS